MTNSKNSDRYLILLEDMNAKLETVAEGYDQLNHKIDTVEKSLRNEINTLRTDLRTEIRLVGTHLSGRIDKLDNRTSRIERHLFSNA